MISIHVSRNEVDRTIAALRPEACNSCSAANFIRCSDIGWSALAPTIDTSTKRSTPARLAAAIRARLPSRSTAAGLVRLDPANPCTAETTRSQPSTAVSSGPRRRSPTTTWTPAGSCEVRRGSRVRTRTCSPASVSSFTTRLPSRPVPPATRITASTLARGEQTASDAPHRPPCRTRARAAPGRTWPPARARRLPRR